MTVSVDTTKTGPQGGGYFSTLTVQAGGTLDIYNTADRVTNYEALRANWAANQAQLFVRQAGTGVQRALAIGISTGSAGTAPAVGMLVSGATPFVGIGWLGAATNLSGPFAGIAPGSYNASSGTQTIVSASPTINQSGTAGYILADFNATETATGSGTKLLQRWAVGGTAVGQMTNSGTLAAQFISVAGSSTSNIGFAAFLGGANDVTLVRDAADTLALRRSTNAQTFRVYNTYTDASNNEYLQNVWSGNVAYIRTVAQGTGISRSLVVGTSGATSLYFQTNNVTRWEVSSSGHVLALTDNTYDIGASGANRPRNIYISGTLVAGNYVKSGSFTVATLSAAGTVGSGSRAMVTDSTVAAAGNYGAIVAGGGANIVPVYSDGTNWRIG